MAYGKLGFTRRRLLRTAAASGVVGLGAAILPAPWRNAS